MIEGLPRIRIVVDSRYHRDQFDDWLAGGALEYKNKMYYWSAQDFNYGFGWEIEPVAEEDWRGITEGEFKEMTGLVMKCLREHVAEYAF